MIWRVLASIQFNVCASTRRMISWYRSARICDTEYSVTAAPNPISTDTERNTNFAVTPSRFMESSPSAPGYPRANRANGHAELSCYLCVDRDGHLRRREEVEVAVLVVVLTKVLVAVAVMV